MVGWRGRSEYAELDDDVQFDRDNPERDDPEGDDPEGDDPEGDDPEGDILDNTHTHVFLKNPVFRSKKTAETEDGVSLRCETLPRER